MPSALYNQRNLQQPATNMTSTQNNVAPNNTNGSPYNPNDPYDPRIGGGALPIGIQGTQERAYTRAAQPNELVSTNLQRITDRNDPYINSAERYAIDYAGSRGLTNSSIAAGAARRAAIDAALPIAQGDAQVYANTASENMGALNQRQLADVSANTSMYNADVAAASASEAQRGALQRQRENLAFTGEQNGLDRAHQVARDYYNYRYDLGRQNNQGRVNTQQYAAQTGINQHAQQQLFLNSVIQASIDQPDVFTPEAVAGIINTYLPIFDGFSQEFDDYISQYFPDEGG